MVQVGGGVRDGAFENVGIGEGTIGEIMLLEVAPASLDVIQLGKDCREFRAGLGMIGAKEPTHAATQRTSYP